VGEHIMINTPNDANGFKTALAPGTTSNQGAAV
jgi:hypothetical protein